MELNPNHPVTQQVSQHWHAICAALMSKMGLDHVVITPADLATMQPDIAITIAELHDGLHLRIVDRVTAEKLARENGGMLN